ncbi:MAG: hydrogenase large subunit [Vulcanimicrobiaceae bacterium]
MTEAMKPLGSIQDVLAEWPFLAHASLAPDVDLIKPPSDMLHAIATRLRAHGWHLGTIVASETADATDLRYCFYGTAGRGWLHVLLDIDRQTRQTPSLTPVYISADRHEREIEDLFSITFTAHPRLGDFVFHDDKWASGIGLMRPQAPQHIAQTNRPWEPHHVLQEEGAFIMPVGPIFSGHAESALFLLETVGEDVVRAVPRLFYKYRAIEKLAEGRSVHDVLLLVERCNGMSALGNGWGYCNAVESALGIDVPARALALRTLLAELERIRHHAGAIREICESTALTVAANQAAVLEEELLRVTAQLTGHRYLFGTLAVGGLARDFDAEAIAEMLVAVHNILPRFAKMREALEKTGSFLDRIENIGLISPEKAQTFELLGPMARASGVDLDLRTSHPYGRYEDAEFSVPVEYEGDGFARLRVLFREVEQSARILNGVANAPDGALRGEIPQTPGSALGWAEAPRGASLHWTCIAADLSLLRYHFAPPSFRNWHGFHIATEDFAFQDFPIILATLDLSVAENDR